MDEKTLKNLEYLETTFNYASQVCDPLDYQIRQRNLVYTLGNFLLMPLMEHRAELARIKTEEAAKNAEVTPVIAEACQASCQTSESTQ